MGNNILKQIAKVPPGWKREWYRTSFLMKDGSWRHEKKNNYHENPEKPKVYNYLFCDKANQKVVKAKVSVEEMEWRYKYLMWTPLFGRSEKYIKVTFSEEVGKRVGTWEGGIITCWHKMKKHETPLATLLRMQDEREF